MSKRRNTRNENYEKRKRKGRAKKIICLVCAFLAGLMVMSGVSALTTEKQLNPNNLLNKKDNYVTALLEETDKGLKIDWTDNGSFVLSGKHDDDNEANNSMYRFAFAEIELEPGTYTLSHGNKKASDETYGLYVQYDGMIKHNVYGSSTTFELDKDTTVIIGFAVKNKINIIYAKFEPVLVKGDKVGSFFVEE